MNLMPPFQNSNCIFNLKLITGAGVHCPGKKCGKERLAGTKFPVR